MEALCCMFSNDNFILSLFSTKCYGVTGVYGHSMSILSENNEFDITSMSFIWSTGGYLKSELQLIE